MSEINVPSNMFAKQRLRSACAFFRQKLTTAHLESAEGRGWPQKIFHDQLSMKECCPSLELYDD